MEKFFITGGQGFIGAWMVRQLLREGTAFVLVDLESNDDILRQVLEPDQLGGLERKFGDVCDGAFVERAVGESGATHVVHLAGLQIPTCRENPALGARVNIIGTLNVFEAVRVHKDTIRSVVYASSGAVVGPAEDYPTTPIPDDAQHWPRTHYGIFKAANEGNARVYWQDHGVASVGLRPMAVYGVGREVGITSGPTKAIRAAVRGEEFTVPFTGVSSFNYAEDIAADFIGCARRHKEGALALNNPGETHSIDEFLRLIEEEIPSSKGRLHCEGNEIPVAYDLGEKGLESILGVVPHTPIAAGIRATAERFRVLGERGIS